MSRPLLVIVPSRGRPDRIANLIDWFFWTSDDHASLLVAVDADDPDLKSYRRVVDALSHVPVTLSVAERNGFAPRLNDEARKWADEYPLLASWGDDHVPRTDGWDTAFCDALTGAPYGVAYGDDLLQGEAVPTAWVQTSSMVRALGWMTPPGLDHLYVDNAIKDLGTALGCCIYLPHVMIEHLHPTAGKSDWDDLYREANSPQSYSHDRNAYEAWRADGLERDVATIRRVCG